VNSSASASAICNAEVRSSDIHDADPTCNRGFARIVAIVNKTKQRASSYDKQYNLQSKGEFEVIRSFRMKFRLK